MGKLAATHDDVRTLARALLARLVMGARRRRRPSSAVAVDAAEVLETLGDPPPASDLAAHDAAIDRAYAALQSSLCATPRSALATLARLLELSELDLAIIAVLLAPELDPELERAYCFALDDFTRKRPDVGFVARLCGRGDLDRETQVIARLNDGPLRRSLVVSIANAPEVAFTMRQVRLADRVVNASRGLVDCIDDAVRTTCRVAAAPMAIDDVVMPTKVKGDVRRAIIERPDARVLLSGRVGTGRGTLVEAIGGELGRDVVRIDARRPHGDTSSGFEGMRIAIREAVLRDAIAVVAIGEMIAGDAGNSIAVEVRDAIGDVAIPVVFTATEGASWLSHVFPTLVELVVPTPTLAERTLLWQRALVGTDLSQADASAVAGRYDLSAAAISHAARRATNAARVRDGGRVTTEDLGAAARSMFSHRLGSLAQRVPVGFRWEDLVLPDDTLAQVVEVVRYAEQRPFLLEEWGFAGKLPYGRGVSAILAGPPGTGKTMVAQLLAHELGYDLFRVDLSQIVNKYIGETEKNLGRVFDEAASAHAVLFFDEADALFARRTEVKSSNDRYANLEVNYLLQRMETFDGVTLLATNLDEAIDAAFRRRVRFTIIFDLPDEHERERLWRSMFPSQTPLAPSIEWRKVARAFEMSGGHIKKAALRAALAAATATPRRSLTTDDIVRAAAAEYREMGRVVAD
ncbi:MAG: ATP-binding protein [Kofleriaceae bacterium]|nr:ATP-binding protein [Kofleriaceae bacterium]